MLLKIVFILGICFHCVSLKGQGIEEDSLYTITPLYDTFVVDFSFSIHDLRMNAEQTNECSQINGAILKKCPQLLPHYLPPSLKHFATQDSILTALSILYKAAESTFDPFLKYKKTFQFSVKHTAKIGWCITSKISPFQQRFLYIEKPHWQIDTVVHTLPTTLGDAPYEFLLMVDSVVRTPNVYILYYNMYRHNFPEKWNDGIKENNQRLTIIPNGNILTKSKNLFVRIKPGELVISTPNINYYSGIESIPTTYPRWDTYPQAILSAYVKRRLPFLKPRKKFMIPMYRVPILAAGEGLTHFQRVWTAKMAEEFARNHQK